MEEHKAKVQSQFSKSAERYVTSQIHARGSDLAKLMQIAALKGNEEVLDVATGGGHVANAFAPFVKKVVAFDLTEDILKVARAFIEGNGHQQVEYVQGDAEQLPFTDERFHIVTCRIAAHHFPNPASFVSEAYRVLKKGGQLLLVDNSAPENDAFDVFYNYVEKERDYSHHRAWKKSDWLKMLEEAGFELEELHCFHKTFIFEDWCDRMNVTTEKKQELSDFIKSKPTEYYQKFKIVVEDGRVYSFRGESILMKARKPTVKNKGSS
ncbi:class I SAM-dependent methyltransferase [Halalkalibacterium halodurans]|uniref:class I SAM-dependent methyltransferase n=1 Tax=Halalkalibacterium halodurans TaxID=86665 RepID=UPI002AAA4624|nr:class I SAM-dependent methyltransferase [Halalkalibacterium halodurans]MDY7222882.1 class I SAM-dependent methyltransferase [Halalkalibacterium halodurans]MDY7242103.1 class I SAM-dependent methyltransferase [Halalkalibacterium halodurans]